MNVVIRSEGPFAVGPRRVQSPRRIDVKSIVIRISCWGRLVANIVVFAGALASIGQRTNATPKSRLGVIVSNQMPTVWSPTFAKGDQHAITRVGKPRVRQTTGHPRLARIQRKSFRCKVCLRPNAAGACRVTGFSRHIPKNIRVHVKR